MAELRTTHPGRPPAESRSVLRHFGISLATAAVVFVLDQVTKALASSHLPQFPDQSIPLVGDALRLTYVMNRGAAFGVLQDQNTFFIVVSGVVIAVIVGSYRYSPVRSPLLNLALGLQLGGALGNLLDRLRLGYVVDFLDVSIWPVFNLADSAIVIGVAMLAYRLLRSPQQAGTGQPAGQDKSGA